MKYRVLGKTGIKVSEVGFGAWAIGGNAQGNSYGPTDDKASIEAVKKTGKIRHYEISIHDPAAGIHAMKTGRPSTIQVVYNILRQEAKNELFGSARENKVAIIAREPLANGFLTGKHRPDETFPEGDIRHNFPRNYIASMVQAADKLRFLEQRGRTLAQAAIRFALDNPDVSTTIPGAKTADQAQENLQASELPPLTGEDLMRIRLLRESSFD